MLMGSQLRYTTTEKEMLAIVHCLKQWRTLVLGRDIIVWCHHKALNFIMTCKVRSARLSRWIMFVQEFNFRVEHVPGPPNKIADILSRVHSGACQNVRPSKSDDFKIMLISPTNDYEKLRNNFSVLREDQHKEAWISTRLLFLKRVTREVPIFSQK